MSVVLRCPSCGTTQASGGECEACHGAGVRYFCTSHEPGQWLDGPSCPRCVSRETHARPAPAPSSVAPARSVRPGMTSDWERPSIGQAFGCVGRLALLALVALLAVVLAIVLLGRGARHARVESGEDPVARVARRSGGQGSALG